MVFSCRVCHAGPALQQVPGAFGLFRLQILEARDLPGRLGLLA
jgi:hypothetical protein